MKNPLLQLREKEHQHAFYAVAIFIMLSILFFFLVSLKSPVKEEVAVDVTTETLIEISFDELVTSAGNEIASTPNTTQVSTPNEVVQNEPSIVAEKNTAPQVDESFHFNPSSGTTDGFNFGDNDGPNVAPSGKDEGGISTRTILKNPDFKANSQEEGKIALKLWIDEAGFVVKAILDPEQSNSGSKYLIDEAVKAAKSMRYSANKGVHSEYVGTKIFSFKKA